MRSPKCDNRTMAVPPSTTNRINSGITARRMRRRSVMGETKSKVKRQKAEGSHR